MKILVTGNLGYIGPAVINEFLSCEESIQVEGFDTGFFAHCLTNVNFFPEVRISYQRFGDVRRIDPKFIEGFDSIVHLAAISNDPMGSEFANVTQSINEDATISLIQLAANAKVKTFVFASSCSMYGSGGTKAKREGDLTEPLTDYAKSKVGVEKRIKDLDIGNMLVTNLRFATACGMSNRLRLDLVLNDFVASAIMNHKIEILSNGSPWRPLIDVKDMARAIVWAAFRHKETSDQILSVNVGRSDWNYQVIDIANAVKDTIKTCVIEVNHDAPADKRSYKVDFSLFESIAPMYLPRTSLGESIKDLVDGIRCTHFPEGNFRDGKLMRLNVLKNLKAKRLLNSQLFWN